MSAAVIQSSGFQILVCHIPASLLSLTGCKIRKSYMFELIKNSLFIYLSFIYHFIFFKFKTIN